VGAGWGGVGGRVGGWGLSQGRVCCRSPAAGAGRLRRPQLAGPNRPALPRPPPPAPPRATRRPSAPCAAAPRGSPPRGSCAAGRRSGGRSARRRCARWPWGVRLGLGVGWGLGMVAGGPEAAEAAGGRRPGLPRTAPTESRPRGGRRVRTAAAAPHLKCTGPSRGLSGSRHPGRSSGGSASSSSLSLLSTAMASAFWTITMSSSYLLRYWFEEWQEWGSVGARTRARHAGRTLRACRPRVRQALPCEVPTHLSSSQRNSASSYWFLRISLNE
jgi:hypothetical protein